MPPNATLEIDIALLGWNKIEKVTGEHSPQSFCSLVC